MRFTLYCNFCKILIEKYSIKKCINTSFYSKYLHCVCKASYFTCLQKNLIIQIINCFFFQINQMYRNFILSYVYFSTFYIHTQIHVKTRTVSKNSINLYQSIHPDKRSINCLSLFNLFSIEINSIFNVWKYFVIVL